MESYQVYQGGSLVIGTTDKPIVINDEDGNPVTGYNGSDVLTTEVWPGGTRAAAFAPVTTWITPSAATITLSITSAETTALDPGRYQGLTRVIPSGQDPQDAYPFLLEVLQGPGSESAPTTYCAYSDLLRYGRSWLRQLQTDDDEAGFAEQLGRGRSWIEDLAHAHYRVASMTLVAGSQAFGPRRSGQRSTWLIEQLADDTLILTDQIREAAAKKTLAYICEGQVGIGEKSGQYARLARMFHSQADYLGTCLTLSLDTNGDGFPDVNIDCSCTDPMDA